MDLTWLVLYRKPCYMKMTDSVLYLCSKYLTKHRCVIHLEVVMLSGCCGCGVVGVVPHTLLIVRLLVETEKRGCPRTETVGRLEHSQWELLQIKAKMFYMFSMTNQTYFSLQRLIFYPRLMCQLSSAERSTSTLHYFCFVSVFQEHPIKMISVKIWGQTLQSKCFTIGMHNQTYLSTHHTVWINLNTVTNKWCGIFLHFWKVTQLRPVEDSDYLLLTVAH